MERPDYDEEIEFWRKRAEYYEKMCMTLIADISDGVKFDSITIDEDGIKFIKKQSERKRGKWIKSNESALRPYMCSECGALFDVDTVLGKLSWQYCPACGAEMKGEDDGTKA